MVRSNTKFYWMVLVLTAMLAFLLGEHVTKSPFTGANTRANHVVQEQTSVQPPRAATAGISNVSATWSTDKSRNRPRVPITKSISHADFAALDAVGGSGRIIEISQDTVSGQGVWQIQLADKRGKLWQVVVRRADDAVLSKKELS